MDEKDIFLRIAKLRVKKNVSAREMSLAIGQNPNYINHIETGQGMPSIAGLLYICEYLNIAPKDFFDMDNPNPEKIGAIVEDLKTLSDEKLDALAVIVKGLKK